MIRIVRIVVSGIVLAAFVAGVILPGEFGGRLADIVARMQFFPALQQWSATSKIVLTIILVPVLTLIFGRIYCSVVCPLGIIQDLFMRRKRKFAYRESNKVIRWIFPAAILFLGALGVPVLVTLFEPFAMSGRIADNLILPAAAAAYRPFVLWMRNFDIYLNPLTVAFVLSATILAAVQLAGIIGLVIWRGRFYCNSICPVGAVLSVLSQFSILGIRINREKCVSCGICRNACKSECIDLEKFRVDSGRCVGCFSCLGNCPRGAISYGLRERLSRAETAAVSGSIVPQNPMTRRDFLVMTGAAACAVPAGILLKRVVHPDFERGIAPPGAMSVAKFNAACTGCHLCVSKCPEKVLRPALGQYGLAGFQQPVLDFSVGYCAYQCNTCGQVCPNGAIRPLDLYTKQHTSIGIAALDRSTCVAWAEDKACGACDEVCPVKAVHMIPNPKGAGYPTVPEMRPELCLGCGACENVCPRYSLRVTARAVHAPVTFEKPPTTVHKAEPPPTEGFAF